MGRTRAQRARGSSSHGPAIKNSAVYEALRAKGMSKSKAARISNGALDNGATKGRHHKHSQA
jgi:hypothetical protein